MNGKAGLAECHYQGGNKFVAYEPIPTTGWSLGIVVPVEEITKSISLIKSDINTLAEGIGSRINSRSASMELNFIRITSLLILIIIISYF